MTFKPAIWRPIAFVLSVLNLVAVGFAAGAAEPWHAAGHATLALAFGLWAQRLGQGPGGSEIQGPLDVVEALQGLEADLSNLRVEVGEMQERLDFAERVLAKHPADRLDPPK